MKKFLMVLLASMMLVGCSGGDTTDNPDTLDTGNDENKVAYVFEVSGVSLSMNQDLSEIKDQLGEAQSVFTSPSCAFEGQQDNVYTYASYQLTTYTNNGKEYVYSITLKDDTVQTKEGIYLGASKDEVVKAYGEDYTDNNGALSYVADDCTLEFLFDGDFVNQITYTATVE